MATTSETTIFTVMSALAQQYNAINLAQGFPDFETDPQLAQLLFEGSSQGWNQYAPMAGLALLRENISAYLQHRFHIPADALSEITVTPGATYGIYTALAACVQPGDEVVVLEPAYDSYVPNIRMLGAVPVTVPLMPGSFAPDFERIKSAITPKTKAIIINSPHNPTGAVWPQADYDVLAGIMRDTDIRIISDEVYEQLVFDGKTHFSVLQHPELRARSFAVFSFGKVFMNTGWKVGYVVAPEQETRAFRRWHQYLSFSVNTPAQYALAHYLPLFDGAALCQKMQQLRDLFYELMQQTAFRMLPPAAGSFFQLASYEGLSEAGDFSFAEKLTQEKGVAAIPVNAFYQQPTGQKLLRFCFAKKEATLREAALKMSK